MIAYVVTSGCYSDYGIEKIFLDKEKAEKYAAWSEDYTLEEYEISDDKEMEEITFVRLLYNFTNNEKTQFGIHKTNSLDRLKSDIRRTSYYNSSHAGEWVYLYRVIENKNYEEEKIRKKYEKVCQDIYAQIKYNQSQGWDEKMIDEWLKTY